MKNYNCKNTKMQKEQKLLTDYFNKELLKKSNQKIANATNIIKSKENKDIIDLKILEFLKLTN